MNKRTLAAVLVLTLCLLSACGRRKTPEPAVSSSQEETILKLDTLAVELPRDLDTAAARKAMAALPELLAPEGVEVEELSVTFGTSHAATIQALEDGGVDLAFLPASDFVRLSRDAVPVLGESLRVEICAGPSDYGAQLAKQKFEAEGFPCLILDGDGCDRSHGGEGQMATRVEAFIEMLEGEQA